MIKNQLYINNNTNGAQIKILLIFLYLLILISVFSFSFVFAHSEDLELNQEIQRGKEIVERFYQGKIKCQDLTDEDFHSVGEYAMEQMVGGSDHLKMNEMIRQMHGEEGENLMHINMGKRFLGCNGSQRGFLGMMPMTKGMMPMIKRGMPPMMGYWGFWDWRGWNFLAPIIGIIGFLWFLVILSFPILVLVLLILGIIYLIKKLKPEIKKE